MGLRAVAIRLLAELVAKAFAVGKGRKTTRREIEVLVRESRQDKLTEVSTPEVRARQRAKLSSGETRGLDELVRANRTQSVRVSGGHTATPRRFWRRR